MSTNQPRVDVHLRVREQGKEGGVRMCVLYTVTPGNTGGKASGGTEECGGLNDVPRENGPNS